MNTPAIETTNAGCTITTTDQEPTTPEQPRRVLRSYKMNTALRAGKIDYNGNPCVGGE
jgi:hypothetical protein